MFMLKCSFKNIFLIVLLLVSASCNWASDFPVVVNKTTSHAIVIPVRNTANESKAAKIIQDYILKATGVTLFIVKENAWTSKPGIYVGKTEKSRGFNPPAITGEGFFMASNSEDFVIYGGIGRGVVYGAYEFIERFLEGKKFADEPGQVGEFKDWGLPSSYKYEYQPKLIYRESFYPMSSDEEYLNWHKLHRFEDLWGIWGHSYFKLVNPSQYFKTNPEYFALENGIRKVTQLCVSNDAVINIAIESLKMKMADAPEAEYWSISAEDDIGYCQCDKCSAIHAEEGTPGGAHLRFVNRIAEAFPDKKFTSLAYTYTMKPPLKTKPAKNVYIMLSTIDAYRTQPIPAEPTAAPFRKALEGWEKLTDRLFVWDYSTQFTNYLAPFPDIMNLDDNIRYMLQHQVKGIFCQGSGYTYSDFAELKSYMIARLMWNPDLTEEELINDFCKGYYKSAGRYISEYINLIQTESRKTNRQIDIYGNPINEYNSYLSPELLDQYSTIFDKAEGAVEEFEKVLNRIYRLRLTLDYTSLQQAKFFGPDKHGYLVQDEESLNYIIKGSIPKRINKFVDNLNRFKITELSEGGITPEAYREEWMNILAKGFKYNMAMEAKVSFKIPYIKDYPAKGDKTINDGVTGYCDYSYNWLCFYGNDIDVTIDMETTKEVDSISFNLLDDPRHWIFLPSQIEVTVSSDGVKYVTAKPVNGNPNLNEAMDEHFTCSPSLFQYVIPPMRVRFVHVKIKNQPIIPTWRFRANKKPMLAIDEIYVN